MGYGRYRSSPIKDFRRGTAKKLIDEGLLKEIPKSNFFYSEPLDLRGKSKIDEDKYNISNDFFGKGIDYFNQFKYKEAIKLFTNAQSLNPHNAFIYEYRAAAFSNLSKYQDARKDIIVAMKLNPTNTQNDTTYYNIMISKYSKWMKTWGPGGTMDKITVGLNAVNQSITAINNSKQRTISEPSRNVNSQNQKSSTLQLKRKTCTMCNGTGHIDSEISAFGSLEQKWCPECHKNMSPTHCHGCKTCPACSGKKYTESYSY